MPERHYTSDIAFTPTVKAIQSRKGSRNGYARMEQGCGWQTEITPELESFIAQQTSFYLATASADGQPYIQHRGGPAGFLRVLDAQRIAFVDFAGNRQYISSGNLAENPKAHLFLMDYAHRQRIKIWGEAQVVEGDAALTAQLMPQDYAARAEQVIVFTVKAWDANCPQHIPVRLEARDVQRALDMRDARIQELEAALARLQSPQTSAPENRA
ncbi:pyridoxamine 5'-phosphate oxidase family protein [Rhodoferax sp. AJA081-3]|uniref:pyridoxamine 5'-phosphate oxidase family protein n=1 Tax=Rhodoferax sp. AJA081-3 TaxID=2752316 RepID=UPI001ADF523F|nr:pyridoxamine 5'-phosphate oxidase family protein [Rhodoferax sp. AJA081-3]QTN27641.1 pyridoxamine 5'-phosphate oxidase family protein [Rhodoferax sp. AJA081-3]